MSYALILAELKSEYRSKQRYAQFIADERRNELLASYPELDDADTQVRVAVMGVARGTAKQSELEQAQASFNSILAKLGLSQDILEPKYECIEYIQIQFLRHQGVHQIQRLAEWHRVLIGTPRR